MKGVSFGNAGKWLLILPLAVILVSGCIGGGGGTTVSGNGVVITKFEPSLNSLESNDRLTLHLEVQNRGDAIGKAAAKLIGIYPNDWGVFMTDQSLDELLPADKTAQTEGQIGTVDWVLTAPDLHRGESRTYDPMVRVFYSYETRIIKPIAFVTSEELRRIVQSGEALSSDPATVSAGPLTVNVKTGQFVRTRDDWQQSYFPIQIDISNSGGGLVAGENYPIGIDITAPPGTMFRDECPGRSQTEWTGSYGSTIPSGLSRPISPKTVFMWNGKDTKITCELKVVNPPEFRQTRELKVTLSYIYYVDQKTQVSVTGTKEWGF